MCERYRVEEVETALKSVKDSHPLVFPYALKDKQLEVLTSVLNKHHTLAVLPTGYGKTDIFILAPLLLNVLDSTCIHVSIVIAPLLSLITDIYDKYEKRGIQLCQLSNNHILNEDEKIKIREGHYTTLLITPECIQKSEIFENLIIDNPLYKRSICLITIDECHLLVQWGDKFRPAYRSIGELRSQYDDVPILMTTATCPLDIKSRMFDIMLFAIHDDVKIVAIMPDRCNIMLNFHSKCGSEIHNELSWYMDELATYGNETRKCIIYCRSIRHTARGFGMILYTAQEKAFSGGNKDFSSKLIAQYHAECEEEHKTRLLAEFRKPDSSIRCLISTVAFGIGIDIPDIKLVIHWGESDTVAQYWQEIGRSGLDGSPSEAHLYHRPMQLRQCQNDMRQFVNEAKTGSCIRKAILSKLTLDNMENNELTQNDMCCSNCSKINMK